MKPILQYQEGGDIKSLFVDYLPFLGLNRTAKNTPQRATSSSEGGEKSSSKVGLKDLLGLVKELKGLPVDNNIVVQQIQSMYEDAALFNNGEMSTNELVSTYLSALRSIRMAEFNQQEFNDARKQVVANGGLNEFAIDLHGNIYIQDQESGEIKNVTPEQYNKIKDNGNYQVLTNSNLLYYRANDPNFAFKNDILNIVSNGIGMKQITEQLLAVSSKIGTSTLKQQGYSEKNAQGIVQGMASLEKAFQQGMTVEGLYHQGVITKDLSEQAKLALTYLWNTLPENARALLKVKGGSTKGAFELILNLVFSGLDSEIEYSSDLIKNPNDSSSNSSSSSKPDTHDKTNWFVNLLNAEGGTWGQFQLNTGTSNSLFVDGTIYGNLMDNTWKPIGNTSMTNVMNGGLSGIVKNMRGISFGDKVIDPEDLNDIMYDNGGGIVIPLPAKIVNGVKVVDLSILDEYNAAYSEYNSQKGEQENPELFAKILEQHHLTELLDENGLPDLSRFENFLVIGGYAVDKNEKFKNNTNGNSNSFIEEVNADLNLIDLLQSSLSTDDKKTNYKIDTPSIAPGDWFNNYDHIYRGNLYIPLSDNENAGLTAGKETLLYSIHNAHERQYQFREKRKSASNITNAELLNM